MGTIYLQISPAQGLVPWYHIPRFDDLSGHQRQQFLVQISFLQAYLSDQSAISRAEADHAIKSLNDSIGRLQSSSAASSNTTRGQGVESIISSEIPKARKWDRRHVQAVWLTSRLLGNERARALGRAFQGSDNLRRTTYVYLISYLASADYLNDLVNPEGSPSRAIVHVHPVIPSKRSYPGSDSAQRLSLDVDGRTARSGSDQNLPPSPIPATPETISQRYWRRASPKAKFKAKGIFAFLCSLKVDDIPEILLLRMMKSTAIWGPDGRIEWKSTPAVSFVVNDLVSGRVFDFILLFMSIGLVHERPGAFGRNAFTISSDLRREYEPDALESAAVAWPRLVLVCHAFPGHWEEQWFIDHGRILLPQMEFAFDHCPDVKDRIVGDPIHGYKVLLALILSTKVPGAQWKLKAIQMAEDILAAKPPFEESDFLHLKGLLEIRKVEISRRDRSVRFDNAGGLDPPVDARSNCIHGMKLRSEAQVCIMKDPSDLDGAFRELSRFKAWYQTSPSAMERHELDQQEFIRCKIMRWQGEFDKAAQALEELVYRLGDRYDETGCSVWSHFIGTLCELHEFPKAERYSRIALDGWDRLEEEGILEEGQKRYRLLRLTLAETLLSAGLVRSSLSSGPTLNLDRDLEDAALIFEDLDKTYQSIITTNWASRLEHLRVFLGRAIIAHMRSGHGAAVEEAVKAWEELLVEVRDCREKEQITGFLEMVVFYARSDLAAQAKDYNKAHEMLDNAKAQFGHCKREYWWTCVGTDFLNLLRDALATKSLLSGIDYPDP